MSALTAALAAAVTALQGLVTGAGGLGLAAVMAVEGVVPVIPSELVLPLAGSQVTGFGLSFLLTVLAATAGSVAGAWVLHGLGRFGGRPALRRAGPLLGLDEARLARAEAWFARRGDLLVFLGRLVPGLRALVSVPAGTARMPLWRFTLLTALGSAVWNAGLIEVGEQLATRWAEVASVASPVSAGLLAAAAAALPVAWLLRRRRAARA
jgi:membrane protein DedA with SNARE-associated domain